ncbi:MAG: AzlD domain-containing protein [Eubacterium sp.]|nr:AzlD domain-containing protein [Eubacterium sp.]
MERILLIILLSTAITFSLRALPFLLFRGERKMPEWLERLGSMLPAAIMAVLVVYCLKDVRTDPAHKGIAELIAAAVVVIVHKWKHNTFLSIFAGTAVCMIMMRIFV